TIANDDSPFATTKTNPTSSDNALPSVTFGLEHCGVAPTHAQQTTYRSSSRSAAHPARRRVAATDEPPTPPTTPDAHGTSSMQAVPSAPCRYRRNQPPPPDRGQPPRD